MSGTKCLDKKYIKLLSEIIFQWHKHNVESLFKPDNYYMRLSDRGGVGEGGMDGGGRSDNTKCVQTLECWARGFKFISYEYHAITCWWWVLCKEAGPDELSFLTYYLMTREWNKQSKGGFPIAFLCGVLYINGLFKVVGLHVNQIELNVRFAIRNVCKSKVDSGAIVSPRRLRRWWHRWWRHRWKCFSLFVVSKCTVQDKQTRWLN